MIHYSLHRDTIRFKWDGHHTGYAFLILTEQQGGHVYYQCRGCLLTRCFAYFLRVAPNGNDFVNNAYCIYCRPSDPWRPEFKGKKLAGSRVSVVLPQGQIMGFWDEKSGELLRTEEFGIRRMKPYGNEFRLQPYKDRQHDRYGVSYKSYSTLWK